MTSLAAGRDPRLTGVGNQVFTFLWIGSLSWVLQLGLFAAFRAGLTTQIANVAALLISTVVNTWANRRWTFEVRSRDGRTRQQIQGLVIVGVTLLLTAGALALLHLLWAAPPTLVETIVVGLATATATLGKFVVMRRWVFAPEPTPAPGDRVAATR